MNLVSIILVAFVGGSITVLGCELSDIAFQRYHCRRAHFICEDCRAWSCPAHRCRREREKRSKCVWGEEEKRCDVCADRNCCTAANSGVLFPCPYFKPVTQERETVASIDVAAEE